MTTTDIEKAEAVLADLDSKLIRLKQRGVELGDERSQIALAAHTGDAKARAHLDAVNAQIVTYHSESDSLFDAIKGAGEARRSGQARRTKGRGKFSRFFRDRVTNSSAIRQSGAISCCAACTCWADGVPVAG
jgi:hypothetical protein